MRWVIPAAFIIAVEYVVALLIGYHVGFHYKIPFRAFAELGIFIAVVGCLGAFFVRLAYLFFRNEDHPTRRLVGEARHLSGWVIGCLLVTAQLAALTWTKVMLPIAEPFWADRMWANLDHAIFGTDPWRLTHALGALPWLDTIYVTWAPMKFLTLFGLLALPESRKKATAILSYFLVMASGALGQYLGSSAGPIFWQQLGLGDRFADLPREPWVTTAANYLWADHLEGGGRVGAGISAMPSMHVAIAFWVALTVQSFWPRLRLLAWCWAGLMLVGSVHLGWHYAVDGIAAILIVSVGWWCARFIQWRASPLDRTLPHRGVAGLTLRKVKLCSDEMSVQ